MILGHEKNEQILTKAIVENRIFPTWIFSGPYGIGKASIAYRFAKCLLSGSKTFDIPDDDPIHKLVHNRIHPDLNVLEQTDESVSIDEIRELFEKLRMAPIRSQWRVVILENASAFNKNVSNSLLKILEEPPRQTVIILICTTTGNLPRTLLSRAIKLHFSPLSLDTVQNFLEERGIPDAKQLAEVSNGSIGLALKMYKNLGLDTYQHLLNGIQRQDVDKALKFVKDNDVDFCVVRECFLCIFREYVREMLTNKDALQNDYEIEKVQKIISLLNHYETYMLDKNAIIAATYERFFN